MALLRAFLIPPVLPVVADLESHPMLGLPGFRRREKQQPSYTQGKESDSERRYLFRTPSSFEQVRSRCTRTQFNPRHPSNQIHSWGGWSDFDLGPGFRELSELARFSNRNEQSLRSILEQMADKALVFKTTKSAEGVTKELYRLLPTVVGLYVLSPLPFQSL